MKKSLIYSLALLAICFSACTKENINDVQKTGKELSLTASLDYTKTFWHYSGNVYWNSTDKLTVFDVDNNKGGVFNISAGGVEQANFTCSAWSGSTPNMAVYNQDASGKAAAVECNEGKYTASVLTNQTGNNANSFSSNASIAIGKIENGGSGYSVAMKNVLGLVKVNFDKYNNEGTTNIKSITLEDANGEANIAGDILIDYNDGVPTCELVDGKKVITRSNGNNVLPVSKGLACAYFCVIPGVSFVPKFSFKNADGELAIVIGNQPIQVERAKYIPCGEPSLSFGKQRETAVFDFSTWCVAEKLVKTANTTTTYTLNTETEYLKGNATIKVTTGTKTCNYITTAGGDLRFYAQQNAGDAYPTIEIPERSGYKIARVSITTNNTTAKNFTLKDTSGNQLAVKSLSVGEGKTPTMTVDVESTTGADGCVFHLADAKSQYQVSKITVTYAKDL